jgi:hypothetical protein
MPCKASCVAGFQGECDEEEGDEEEGDDAAALPGVSGTWKGQAEPIGLADLSEVADLLAEGLEAAGRLVEHLASCPEWNDPAAPPS